jgi:hypothetical protein
MDKEIKIENAEDLANVFKSGALINEKAIDENLDLLIKLFKGTPYEIKEEE